MKPLKDYQKKIVKRVIKSEAVVLHVGMGLGKTRAVLEAIKRIKDKERKRVRVLVVAPLHVVETTWPDEIKKWGLDLSYCLLRAKRVPNREALLKSDADIYAINFEMIYWIADRKYRKECRKFDILVIDEITKAKSTKTAAFRFFKGRRDTFRKRIGMTGTLLPESYVDLYGQMTSVVKLWETKEKFLSKHFKNESQNPQYSTWVVKNKKSKKKIEKKIAPYVLTLDSEDYLDVPPFVEMDYWYDLPPKLRSVYDEMESEMFLRFSPDELMSEWGQDEDPEVGADTVAAMRLKLRQVISGFIYDEQKQVLSFDDTKFNSSVSILTELGRNCLVMYQFIEEMEQFLSCKKLKTRRLKTSQDITDWNAKKIPQLIGHPLSMGHGLNLQDGGHDIFWYSLPRSAEQYQQALHRLRRTGQTEPTRIHRILYRNTIDEVIVADHVRKHTTSKSFTDSLKAYYNRRTGREW